MSFTRTILAVTTILALLTPLPAAGPPLVLPSEVSRWIEELGDDSFTVREAASKKLLGAGASVEPALLAALESKDAEVVRRVKIILAEFKWGIYPDTPPGIVELIRAYRAAARSERGAAVRKLLVAGSAGCRALAKIARAEEDPQVRGEVFAEFASTLSSTVPGLLEEGNGPAISALLELALASDRREAVLHYTAYHLTTSQLPARVAEWQRHAKMAVVPKAENAVLAYLYRAQGDWAKARMAALAAERGDLQEAFLYEQADWKELAAHRRYPQTEDTTRYLGYRGAYGRLGGNKKLYEDAVADLLKTGRRLAENKNDVLPYTKALFLNGRAGEAVELLQTQGASPKMLFEVLAAQGRIKEALAVVEARRKAGAGDLPTLEILEAKILYNLGEKEKAVAALKKHAGNTEAIEAELSLGRRDEAFGHAATILRTDSDGVVTMVFEKFYEGRGKDAGVLWRLLKLQAPTDTAERRVERLRSLWEGKATEKDAKAFLNTAMISHRERSPEESRVLGEVAVACKLVQFAEQYFRDGATCRTLTRLADLFADRKQWDKAAAQYLVAYQTGLKAKPAPRGDEGEGLPALALWLSGHALTQAGRGEEGKARTDRAHVLPLGDGEMRYDFARALRRRGHREAAAREHDLLRRAGEPALAEVDSYYTGEGFRAAATDAVARKDYLKAADGYEQAFLRCLQRGMNFARSAAYVTVPGYVGTLRARGLVAAGRINEAIEEAERTRGSMPGGADLAIHLVPELERRGRKKDAEALYRAAVEHHEGLARDWPKCAWAWNQLGWLAACCRRDLEKGLAQARKAIELSPETAGYHDTLAEVLFQLGKKDEAIAAIKKAIALSPSREYYKRQVKRIEAGDSKTPRPDDDE